jgi:hypothetical protein
MKFCHSQENGGTGEHHLKPSQPLSEGQKSYDLPPSYAYYRPKTSAVIVLNMGQTLRGECIQEG